MTSEPLNTTARILVVIKYLTTGKRTANELHELCGVHVRTVYRYIRMMKDIGFHINQDADNRYWIPDVCCPFCKQVML